MRSPKANPSMVQRFTGPYGKTRLIDALLRQTLISGDIPLAKRVAKIVQLIDVKTGKELTRQGGNDNDLFFILSGSVSVRVNGREIAIRGVGEHIGEMAMVDSTARRSASIVAIEASTFAKMTEEQFTKVAAANPILWKRIAITLVNRLRERSKFHPVPRSQPAVFIGSSSEGSQIAESLYNYLLRFKIVPRLWSEGVFEASKTAIEDLVKQNLESDFAIIILTPDDITRSRGKAKASPRDNAIFELGLFMGGLSRDRTYFVTPRGTDIKIPTDLLGVTRLEYQPGETKSHSCNLRSVKRQLYKQIMKYGPR